MSELKPCPFCGGEAFLATIEHSKESRPNGYRYHGRIMCKKCQASCGTTGFDETKEKADKKAINAWNRRVIPKEIKQKDDVLKHAREGLKEAEIIIEPIGWSAYEKSLKGKYIDDDLIFRLNGFMNQVGNLLNDIDKTLGGNEDE